MFSLKLFDTLSGKKEVFGPFIRVDRAVKMYVCGVTPYDYSHLGHGRVYVTFDVLFRILKFLGYGVDYCRNFTDIDDKILNRAKQEYGEAKFYKKVSDFYIGAFEKDLGALNCLVPTFQPRVTEHIKEIVTFVEALVAKGLAYSVDGDVYFSIESFRDYGKLSKRNLDDLKVGARISLDERKRNPLDFSLWKKSQEGVGWESPWGMGRPGWHIECSVISKIYLGESIDIHGGGMDLIFPHHENEIAQSESLSGKEFARYWLHNAFLRIDKEKMSKSLGNFLFLKDVFEKYDPMVLRLFFLQHHYRSPVDFSFAELEVVEKNYKKLVDLFGVDVNMGEVSLGKFSVEEEIMPETREILDMLCDNLNTTGVFGIIFKNREKISENQDLKAQIKYILNFILGLKLRLLLQEKCELTDRAKDLIEQRERARAAKDWKTADSIRDELLEMGVKISDKKSGS